MKRVTSNKRAFTLIELLVVVLIIGILAAVAVPQYQKAVVKSRLAAMWPIINHIEQSMRLMALRGESADTLRDFPDIDLPCEEWEDDYTCIIKDFGYSAMLTDTGNISVGPFSLYYDKKGNLVEKECDSADPADKKYCQAIGCPNTTEWVCSSWSD